MNSALLNDFSISRQRDILVKSSVEGVGNGDGETKSPDEPGICSGWCYLYVKTRLACCGGLGISVDGEECGLFSREGVYV